MTESPTPVSGDAMELVEELRKWVNHNGGHDSSAYIRDIRVGVVIAAINEIERLQRIERNRDMWKAQCERQAERLRSQGGAPGWKLVPVEPTFDMLSAAQDADCDHGDHEDWVFDSDMPRIYRAMLSAAPQPPVSQSVQRDAGALSAERASVIEECAKVAGTAEDDDDGIDRQLRKRIAAAIRALGKQTGGAE